MYCSKCGKQVDTSTRFCPDCGNDLSAVTNAGKTTPLAAQPPEENETDLVREGLKDEYELEKELGRGGMAVVYKARDKQLDREVAIKVLPFSLSFDAEFVERFQREARTAGKLEHPNIIPIYRVGRSGRVIYFVMKFIRGKSLSAVIEARGAMAVPDIKRFLVEATRALGYAHKHGIVHRDIKPDNIMFDELGQAIVADFGIAKAQSGAKLTGTGMSIGTPHYMSPEQARAQNLDGRSDIYSLGVVAYQALTGHVPFDGEDSFSIGYKHIMEELPVPTLATAEQREMFQVIAKMMAKKPDDRWQSADELIAAIEGVQVGAGADMATMRTLAMEPMKAPAKPGAPPPMTSAPTTPLPRASASMGKPKEAEKDETKASPPRPAPPAKPSFKPKEVTPRKSYAVPIGIAAALVLVGGGLGGYVLLNKKTDGPGTQVAANTPGTVTAPPIDSHPPLDTSKAGGSDTAKAPATTPPPVTTPAKREPATSRTPATTRTPTVKPPTTRPAPTPTVTPPTAATATPGATGTISLGGTIPAGARIMVDGQPKTGQRFKVPAGQHTIDITAQGFQPYSNRVTVAPNATQSVVVTMAAATGTAPTTAPPPATANAATAATCATANGSRANAGKACYDSPPIPNTPTVLPPPASCTGRVTPSNLLVQVSAQGEVVGTPTVSRGSNCPAFNAQAVAQIQEITFTPAKKGGTPVVAWRVIQMSPARQ